MLAVIRQALALPEPKNNTEFNIQAHLLDTMIVVLWLGTAATLIVILVTNPDDSLLLAFLAVYLAFVTTSFVVRRRGYIESAAKMIALSLWALGVIAAFAWQSVTPATIIVFATAMITSALLLSKRLSITLSLLIIAVCTVVFAATESELWPSDSESLSLIEYAMLTSGLMVITIILANARDSLAKIVGKARTLAAERGTLIEQLQNEIDERKRVETALHASQNILKEAKHIAKLGSFSMDRDTPIVIFSEQAHAILGLDVETPVTSELCLARFGVDLVANLKQSLEEVAASGQPFAVDHEFDMPDGTRKALHFSARPVAEGERFFGIIQDITDRIATEKVMQRLNDELTDAILDLENEQNLLRSVLDAIPVRVFWKDLDLRYLGCNQLLADDANLASWKNVVGKNDYELIWAAQAEEHRADDRAIIESGQPRLNTEQALTFDSSQNWVRSSKTPLRDSSGTIIGVLGIYEDITEQRRMEQALRESEATLKQAQEIAKMGNFEFDITDQTVKWSDGLYRILGLDVGGDITLEVMQSLMRPQDFQRMMELAYRSLETGEPYSLEYEIEPSSGSTKYFYAFGRPLEDIHGNRTRVFGIVQDITERKKIEIERERLAAIVSNSADVIG
ncbi:MAG: PAS domain-containing protein, partial [Anaerolineae bacterium]|nr:PAS domain-containing protein [Anaerolineae bacterium]